MTPNPKSHGQNRVPMIRLWDLVLVPLQGEITDDIAEQLNDDVLSAIHRTGCSGLIIDVTGLWMMDSHLCSVLTRLAEASALIGTRTVLSGMNPDAVLTLQAMDIHLQQFTTVLTVEQALEFFDVQLVRANQQLTRGELAKLLATSTAMSNGNDRKENDDVDAAGW